MFGGKIGERGSLDLNIVKGTALPCSSPWVLSSPHCFQFMQTRSNQAEAKEACKKEGGRLVEVENQDKQEAIEKMVRETVHNWENKFFWIGLTRAGPDGEFLWEESQRKLDFKNWAPNEPGRNKECTNMKIDAAQFSWVGRKCENFARNSLCEK